MSNHEYITDARMKAINGDKPFCKHCGMGEEWRAIPCQAPQEAFTMTGSTATEPQQLTIRDCAMRFNDKGVALGLDASTLNAPSLVFRSGDNRELFSIDASGKLTIGDGMTMDDVAIQFWKAIKCFHPLGGALADRELDGFLSWWVRNHPERHVDGAKEEVRKFLATGEAGPYLVEARDGWHAAIQWVQKEAAQ